MARESTIHGPFWATLVASAALGAAAMYLLDPDKGKRRRAIARDKTRSMMAEARDAVGVAGRDASHRIEGLRARARHLFVTGDAPDDLRLIERVRARMGRVVAHPHAIQVGSYRGRVTLSGPILAHEVERLLDVVRSVWGVNDVEDQLVVHANPASVSSLQGTNDAHASQRAGGNWAPAFRMAAVVAGSAMVLEGTRQRSLAGYALAGVGVALALRASTNLPMSRLAGIATGRQAIDLQKTIHVSASPEVVYDMWANWENFPRFMTCVEAVRDLGDGRARWIVTGPTGARLEWTSILVSAARPRHLAWRTESRSALAHEGSVRLEPFADGTRISVRMSYQARGGIGRALVLLLGKDPRRQLEEDLARMKNAVEAGTLQRAQTPAEAAPRPPLH